MKIFCEIAIPIPVNKTYSYYAHNNLAKLVKIGQRVKINFRNRITIGYIVNISTTPPIDAIDIKPVIEIIDIIPLITHKSLKLAKWMSDYYITSIGDALKLIIPNTQKIKEPRISLNSNNNKPNNAIALTKKQEIVYNELIKLTPPDKALIYGITGSGKTEIYIKLMKQYISRKKQVIYLVPEISLTEQVIKKIYTNFDVNKVAVIHSNIKKEEKLYYLTKMVNNEIDIVLGARSAIFSPLKKLGLIIVDEENDSSYKSSTAPRYNARQIAFIRSKIDNALLIFGTATPSVELYYQAKLKKIKVFYLKERFNGSPLPEFNIIDLRKDTNFSKKYPISSLITEKINETIKKKEQVLMFINRRGFANYVFCKNCGYVITCKNCNISLTYHKKSNNLECHYCGHTEKLPNICPKCNSINLNFAGAGTEKIETLLKDIFSNYVIERLDTDITKKKGRLSEILKNFESGKIDILTGTQIISRGLNFPFVSLAVILFIDDLLNLPDFRTAENVFNLIVQVAGRAGRAEIPGEVYLQTFLPNHYAIKFATNYQFNMFYEKELKLRKSLNYPPFTRLIKITFSGENLENVIKISKKIGNEIKEANNNKFEILGPTQAPISKLHKKFRYHILIKINKIFSINKYLHKLPHKVNNVLISIDIDPISLL